jgi:hypothetical protein
MVSLTPRPLYPRGKSPRYPLDRRQDGLQSWLWRRGEEKILHPTGTRNPTPRSSSPKPVTIWTALSRLLWNVTILERNYEVKFLNYYWILYTFSPSTYNPNKMDPRISAWRSSGLWCPVLRRVANFRALWGCISFHGKMINRKKTSSVCVEHFLWMTLSLSTLLNDVPLKDDAYSRLSLKVLLLLR